MIKNITPEDEVNWNVVQIIIEKYTERHAEEVMGCAEYVKQRREALANEFAETSDKTQMRHMYELPPSLAHGLSHKYPLIFKGENLTKFLKMYPIFQVAQKL